ncbi:hypothetical protein ES332_A02G113800v1 [Gossypium tomentosum]|uniref:Uncharacterized protein n=1 Tax=Gossypium tomentosum TaxID=34277 RepID=A0A5D2RGY6_GOSTO|nr:hypothetical protein ES332_A02G113800v1 [Gossypium tomentosum]
MEPMKEESSVSRAPLLVESLNYAYRKAHMKALYSTKQSEGKAYYTAKEKRMASENSKSLNTNFSNVDIEQFKVISMCESAKEAWTVLLNQHEDITALKLNEMIDSYRNFELNY